MFNGLPRSCSSPALCRTLLLNDASPIQAWPDEDSFAEYLSSNGGSSNAFTAAEDTAFYFEMSLPNPARAAVTARELSEAHGGGEVGQAVAAEAAEAAAAARASSVFLGPEGALARFASFFKAPLLTASGAGREVSV